jgi:hypothetical protein
MVRRGELPPRKRNYELATIGSSASLGYGFRAICEDCRHQAEWDCAEFMAKHGLLPETTFYELAARMRCGSCSSTNICLMAVAPNPYSELEKKTGVKGAGIGTGGWKAGSE